ncbi:MAG: protein-L-isoaspartate O-methyltransferase [Alphaproteobacteria bacterium]|nr:protein-L-isoaspartate O-methyltransferase [Alphaproteobacteria bacterium]
MDHATARRNMVDCQLRPTGVVDPRLIAAMGSIPREAFLPRADHGLAYMGAEIEVASGRVLSAPLTLARLIQLADIKPSDVVLHVGSGAGYGTAVLSQLASTVVALDSDKGLNETANRVLSELGMHNAAVLEGPMHEGYPKQAPYDVIVIEGLVGHVPESLLNQLAEGGRLAALVSAKVGALGRGTLYLNVQGTQGKREVFDAAATPLPGFALTPGFIFA